MVGEITGECITPMIVPAVLIAIGTFYVICEMGFVHSILGLALCHTALAVPSVMFIITSALRAYERNP